VRVPPCALCVAESGVGDRGVKRVSAPSPFHAEYRYLFAGVLHGLGLLEQAEELKQDDYEDDGYK
jgi:hypothetical protein